MTDIDGLIESWEAAGVMFAIEGDTVTITLPAGGLAAAEVALLREHREDIRALLRRRRDALVRLLTAGCLVTGCEGVAIGWIPAAGDAGVCRAHGLFGHLLAEAAMAGRAEAAWQVARAGDEAAGREMLTALVTERTNREAIATLAGRGL